MTSLRPLAAALFPLVSLCAVGCGGSDPKTLTDEGTAALHSGDAPSAVSAFDRALGAMDPAHPDFLRASIGRCQALARIDPNRAKDDFLALAGTQPTRVREPEFTAVTMELIRKNSIEPAAAVAEAGIRIFPDSAAMKALRDAVGDAAKKASDPEALQRMKGLGYAGDG